MPRGRDGQRTAATLHDKHNKHSTATKGTKEGGDGDGDDDEGKKERVWEERKGKSNRTDRGQKGGTGRRVVMRDAKRDARQKHKLISCRSYLHTMPAPGGYCCLPCFARPGRIRRTYTVISWGTAILEDSCAHGKEENEEKERLVTERERGREVGDQW